MSEQRDLIVDTAAKLFGDGVEKSLLDAAETGVLPEALWASVRETGFNEVGSAPSGTTMDELYALLEVAGRHAVPLPLAETLFANAWVGVEPGISSIGVIADNRIVDVPWGRSAGRVIGITETGAAKLVTQPEVVEQDQNMAGEPRDVVSLPGDAPSVEVPDRAWELLALARASLVSGALSRTLDLSLQYASEREQFGRTISKFQAVQHNLAVMAAEVAAARRAATAAVDALGTDRQTIEIAAAKARSGEAVGIVAEAAHQVHGAIGYTHEHQLHHYTRRLWAWRDEYGNEAHWQRVLGTVIAAVPADDVWAYLTG